MKIDQFLVDKRRIQGTTQENYERHLRNLEAWAATEQIAIGQLTSTQFIAFLASKPWGNSMQRGSYYALRSYLRWRGHDDHALLEAEKLLPRLKPTNKRFLTHDNLMRLLAACDKCQGHMPIRNRAILLVLFDSWVRASELCDIRLNDLERELLRCADRRFPGSDQG